MTNETMTHANVWFMAISAMLLLAACMGFATCVFKWWLRKRQ